MNSALDDFYVKNHISAFRFWIQIQIIRLMRILIRDNFLYKKQVLYNNKDKNTENDAIFQQPQIHLFAYFTYVLAVVDLIPQKSLYSTKNPEAHVIESKSWKFAGPMACPSLDSYSLH